MKPRKISFPYTFDLGILGEWEGTVTGYFMPGDPGCVSGPPENCCPPEPAEFELLLVTTQSGMVDHFLLSMTWADEAWADLVEEAEQVYFSELAAAEEEHHRE